MTCPRIARAIVVIAVAVSLTSCGGVMEPTLNRQQASDRLQRYVHDSVAALTPYQPTLRPFGDGEGPCDDADDGGPNRRISLYVDYFFDGIPKGPEAAPLFDKALAYWTSHGFRLRRDERPTSQSIDVENVTDGFRIGLDTGEEGIVSISASSPCIWPNGTPEPTGQQ